MNERHEEPGHLSANLRELVHGTFPEAEAESAWSHLGSCEECARDLEAARSLYEAGLLDGRAHVSSEKLVAHAEGRLPLSHAERAHFERCTDCRQDLELLGTLPDLAQLSFREKDQTGAPSSATGSGPNGEPAAEKPETDPRSSGSLESSARFPRRGRPRWWSLGGAMALATAVFAVVLLTRPEPVDTSGLARIAPIEVRVPRSSPRPESFEGVWVHALAEYAAGRYEAAAGAFRRAVEMRPDHAESWVLLGSCALLRDRLDEATTAFEEALERNPEVELQHEARWQLTMTTLARGDVPRSRMKTLIADLDEMASGAGTHAAEARDVLAELRARQ